MERPNLSIRSTKGCWTCRLRKKKCDEVQPGCHRCESVNIECHYGIKPDWIEDPAKGKEELERVKKIVAVAASRKRSEHRAKSRARAGSQAASSSTLPTPPGLTPIQHQRQSSARREGDSPRNETSWLSRWNSLEEANSIMHYLDHVFYIQFRFYTPSMPQGSRGWFLSLLTKTKPLYHAALSLSAFHQKSLNIEQGNGGVQYLHELESQHNLTLKELQLFIEAESQANSTDSKLERNVQILACIVLLVSFELFQGGTNIWPVHLNAASNIVLTLHNLQQPQSPAFEKQTLLQSYSPEQSALKFFSSCVIWFDALSCVSLGAPTRLTPHYKRLILGPTPELGHNIELSGISGCQNWIAILIGKIASLTAEKKATQYENKGDLSTFEKNFKQLHSQLVTQYTTSRAELDEFRTRFGRSPPHWKREDYSKHIVLVVTCVFGSAAFVLLESIKNPGAKRTDSDTMKEVIDMLRLVPEPAMYRVLVWPVCVAGCMASTPAEQDFFRSTAKSAVNDSKTFGNSTLALDLLEKSWLLQAERGHLVDCTSTIHEFETTAGILLV